MSEDASPDTGATARVLTDRIAVEVSPAHLELTPGGRAQVTLNVTNQGQVTDRLGFHVEGIDPRWFTVRVADARLMPGASGLLELEVHLPDEPTLPADTYTARLVVSSEADPQTVSGVDLPIQVRPMGELQMELSPQLVTTRWSATYQVRLSNTGNAERVVDLTASDPEAALAFKLEHDRVAVAPGATRDVLAKARPRQRVLVGLQRQFSLTVIAMPAFGEGAEVAEPLAGVEGVLVYRPPLAFLVGMPPRLRRLLLALLALLVLAALLALLLANGLGPRPGPTPTEAAATPPAAAPTPQPAPTFTPQPAQVTAPPVVTTVATPPPQPKPKPPTINRFEVVAAQDGGRDRLMLSWDVSKDATDVKVLGQGGRPLVGTQPIEAVDDAEFDLEASNDGGTATRKVAIVLLRLPEISTLSASATDVDPGQAVTLTWMTRHAERADLNGETVTPAGGTRTEHPERSTTYTLVVENELGRVSQSVAVNVRGSPAVGAP